MLNKDQLIVLSAYVPFLNKDRELRFKDDVEVDEFRKLGCICWEMIVCG